MKAVLIERPHEVSWVELETPKVGPGEVLVRSHAAGVCRTDLEMLHGGLTDPRWVQWPSWGRVSGISRSGPGSCARE
jgi:D-arabinose 1-dehydrogenase-like Zn-dependent alcohol dehydrogenase